MSITHAANPAVGGNRLPVLASTINAHLTEAEAATRRGLEHAIAAGLLLIEAKELVSHGEWIAWLQANCQIGQRQAQTYMRLARNRHRFDATKNAATAYLTIAAAEAIVGRPRPERPHGLAGQLDLLGGPEITAPPRCVVRGFPPIPRDRLREMITEIELAIAFFDLMQRRSRSPKSRANFWRGSSAAREVLAYLRAMERGKLV
jgi:Protein of unknown function (DUF3102)